MLASATLRANAPIFHPSNPSHKTRHHRPRHHNRRPKHTCTPQRHCPFLHNLPGELRNQIYELVLISSEPVLAVTIVKDSPNSSLRTWASTVPALAQTCAQIRRENLGMYYAENTFVFAPRAEQYLASRVANGWVKSLARAGMERHVSKVGCVWQSMAIQHDRVVPVKMCIIAMLGEDDSAEEKREKERLRSLLGEGEVLEMEAKVGFDVRTPREIGALCVHVLDRCGRAFENRRKGKSVRGYGALIDMILTVCNFLAPKEGVIYPKECPECEASMDAWLRSQGLR